MNFRLLLLVVIGSIAIAQQDKGVNRPQMVDTRKVYLVYNDEVMTVGFAWNQTVARVQDKCTMSMFVHKLHATFVCKRTDKYEGVSVEGMLVPLVGGASVKERYALIFTESTNSPEDQRKDLLRIIRHSKTDD